MAIETEMRAKTMRDRFLDQRQRLYLTLLIFAASLLASALVIFQNNSLRTFPIFFFLLFLGAGIMLALGVSRGVLAGLLMISAWIAVKQLLGIWEEVRLLDHLLELIMVGLTFLHRAAAFERGRGTLDPLSSPVRVDPHPGAAHPRP
jgi:hypothetical protein